ncbi:MAG: long-chain fatty acid--CoA ligase, partial [Pseudomonadota bacterium]
MHNLMQDWEMRVSHLIDHAAKYHPKRTITTRTVEGPIEVSNWAEVHKGAKKTAQALIASGMKKGDVVGVMA